jgi:hypothetical protein
MPGAAVREQRERRQVKRFEPFVTAPKAQNKESKSKEVTSDR